MYIRRFEVTKHFTLRTIMQLDRNMQNTRANDLHHNIDAEASLCVTARNAHGL